MQVYYVIFIAILLCNLQRQLAAPLQPVKLLDLALGATPTCCTPHSTSSIPCGNVYVDMSLENSV